MMVGGRACDARGEELRSILREAGLTEYEALAYIALVNRGPMTAREVSEASGVPYTRVYDALRRLEEKGWAIKVSERPLVYQARPPAEVSDELRRRMLERWRKIDEALRQLQAVYEQGAGEARVMVYRDPRPLLRAISHLLAEEDEHELLMTLCTLDRTTAALLRTMVTGRNIRVRILAWRSPENIRLLGELLPALSRRVELRWFRGLAPVNVILARGRFLILGLPLGGLMRRAPLFILTTEPALLEAASLYFELLWERAPKEPSA